MSETVQAHQAKAYLEAHLLGDQTEADLRALQPTSADFQALFGPERGAELEVAYQALWAQGLPRISPARTRLRIIGFATAGAIAAGEEQGFAGGFVQLAPHLPPESAWVAFKCTEPDKLEGMRFDGLCARGEGRWAWFPKLWRFYKP